MARVRVSTTVDEGLISAARTLRSQLNDAALIDEALSALLKQYRSVQIDSAYAAYEKMPLDTPDEWGDLSSFREGAAAT